MILLPALSGISALIQLILEGALIGALFGGAIGGGGTAITEYQTHGEINQQGVANVAKSVGEGAIEGAVGGAVTGGLLGAAGPALHPVLAIIDDFFRGIFTWLDDAARPIINAVDDLAAAAKQGISRVAASVAHGLNRALNSFRARIYKLLPHTKVGAKDGWVYVIKDPKTGMTKIGDTSDPKQRLSKLQKDLGNKGVKYDCIIHSHEKNALEKNLHQNFSNLQKNHPIPHSGMTEWFVLTGAQVAYACSH